MNGWKFDRINRCKATLQFGGRKRIKVLGTKGKSQLDENGWLMSPHYVIILCYILLIFTQFIYYFYILN